MRAPRQRCLRWLPALGLAAWGSFGCATTGTLTPAKPIILHQEPELVASPPSTWTKPSSAPSRHRVAAGETLYRIALAHGLAADELAKANGIDDPRTLAVGQELLIPKAPTTPAATESKPPSGTLSWPVRGVLYARFGKKGKEPHDGIDLAAPSGTPVQTAAEGKVLYAGEQKGYGLIAIVEHKEGLVTLYAHNRDLRVTTGQKVRPGQVIATVGESGRTSGPHLHFEVRVNGLPVDPLLHLGPVPDL
ncbi:MAG: M23 family metallopeptidase, partial [Myxococcota bacterium]